MDESINVNKAADPPADKDGADVLPWDMYCISTDCVRLHA